jgi:hypothetical protein
MMEKSTRVGNGKGSVVGDSDWGVVSDSDWGVMSDSDWGDGLVDNSWGRTVNNSVESVDWVSGVGNGTDGTIGLNKGVLSLDNISVAGFVGGLLVSGESIRNGISVVVLWMGIVWLGCSGDNSLGNWLSISDLLVEDGLGNGNLLVEDGLGYMVNLLMEDGLGNCNLLMEDGLSNVLYQWCMMSYGQWRSIGVSDNSSGVSQGSSWKGSCGSQGGEGEETDEPVHDVGFSVFTKTRKLKKLLKENFLFSGCC